MAGRSLTPEGKPVALSQKFGLTLRTAFETAGVQLALYLVLAGLLWMAFYHLFRRRSAGRKIVPALPTRRQIGREVLFSLRSIAVFGIVTTGVVYAAYSGWTRIYTDVDRHGWVWFWGSIAVAVMMHDAYFYGTHRLLHRPALFRSVHRTHHQSTNPTPWAAYCFSIGEALVQAGIGPLVVLTIPMHPAAFGLFMLWQISFNVFGHLGYEVFPGWFLRSPLGRFFNTPTHHALHHEQFRTNFGLYFNVWDRLMGTNHPGYEARFAEVTTHRAPMSRDVAVEEKSRSGP